MKEIEKAMEILSKNKELSEEAILTMGWCPHKFGLKDKFDDCHRVHRSCSECWNEEVEGNG